jgi:hypothetical protein
MHVCSVLHALDRALRRIHVARRVAFNLITTKYLLLHWLLLAEVSILYVVLTKELGCLVVPKLLVLLGWLSNLHLV